MMRTVFTVQLDANEREALAELARTQDRSAGAVVRRLIRQAFDEHASQRPAQTTAQQRTARVRGAAVYQRRDCTGPVARIVPSGERITIDRDYGDGIVHLADGSGFMRKVETDLL